MFQNHDDLEMSQSLTSTIEVKAIGEVNFGE